MVKGDIHDNGKNIVFLILENYGFYIFNFGKDVIELARKEGLNCVFIIEGMLVAKSYAKSISAEYAEDDVEAVHVTLRYKT